MGLKRFKTLAMATSIAFFSGAVWAADDSYPEKDINIIVGYSAGGGTDVMARTLGSYMEKYLGGAKFVVKNVPGAGGLIGFTQTSKSDPDGYTIGTFNLPGVMARTHDRKTEYSADSFTYLANVVNDPNVIVVNKTSDLKSLGDLVNKAKETPEGLTVAMSTLGGDDQFTMINLSNKADINFTYIPFKGTAPARTALMGGHVDVAAMNLSEAIGFEDEIRVLAVTSAKRSPLAPDFPTAKEQGYDFTMGSMRGVVGPANLPEDVKAKLIEAMEKTYQDPEFQKAMAEQGAPLEFVAGEAFEKLVMEQDEFAKGVWETTPWSEQN
uniref:Bug family tripartite tricarboxylate transporter substrate binding protein n=1 Tax=Marinobacterium profundum TaxID=1714300 RepID=UPI00082BC18A|nr:tripartite tricarboxylate transporter substrate binding protein [Marinobacterium profundum]